MARTSGFLTLLLTLVGTLAVLPIAQGADVQGFDLVSVVHPYGYGVSISDDGRYVAYNYRYDLYVRDRTLGKTVRASVANDGSVAEAWAWNGSISGNGRYAVFLSDFDLTGIDAPPGSVYVRDLQERTTELVNVGPLGPGSCGEMFDAAISDDGRYVLFAGSGACVAADQNASPDVYLRDRVLGRTELVSVDRAGQPAGFSNGSLSISDDGRYVAFTSYSHQLVAQETLNGGVYVRDRVLGTTELVNVNWAGQSVGGYGGMISGNGRFVAFSSPFWNMVQGDTNRAVDIFVRDRVARTTERVSVSTAGAQANGPSGGVSISEDGRFVSFASTASNLVAGDDDSIADVFLRDRHDQRTIRVAPGSADRSGIGTALTADARAIAFETDATLVPGDIDQARDVYVGLLSLVDGDGDYAFTVKPRTLDFGQRALGSTTTLNLWLRNKDTRPLPILRVLVRGDDATVFTTAHTCGVSVAPGAGCAIHVTFTPVAAGPAAAKAVVVAGARQVRERPVLGTGVQTP